MAHYSKIEWTQTTWNPVTGCTKVSPGCLNCYAERMAKRLKAMGQKNYRNGFELTLHEHVLQNPFKWRHSKIVFVNSMSDLFHEDVPDEFIFKVFDVMRKADWHLFQVLTKRAKRLKSLHNRLNWPENVWMGVTVENSEYLDRIDDLRTCNSKLKFISFEPLLGKIYKPNLTNIDWVIVGGESGPGARHIDIDWVRHLRDHCFNQDIPFFFKQWGGFFKKKNGRILDKRKWEQMPKIHS